ncbi:hypothetical protein EDB89DRAFT_250751 [Lactarius sanguifluus]|nr:hypothetical protein EDB89DRAFT_250751 [Lactarius sanguifluus]
MYAEFLARLRHLDLTQLKESHLEDVDAELFFSALSDGTRYVHQHLESLSVSCICPYRVTTGRPEYAKPPWENLRTFSIINGLCNWAQLSTSMRHLTSFEYKRNTSYTDFRQFHHFLQANPRLEKLVIEGLFGPRYPGYIPAAPDSLTLAHLRYLELTGLVPFHIRPGNFSLPSLRILRITSLQNAVFMLTQLVEDVGTSFAELVEFTARDCFLESQILTSVLFQAPKLEILNCTGNAVNIVAESLTNPAWCY